MSKQLSWQSQRQLAFISLALGFLVIWTAVLAGLLISKTLKEDAISKESLAIFKTHEDIAKVTFALGHEMVVAGDLTGPGGRREKGGMSHEEARDKNTRCQL